VKGFRSRHFTMHDGASKVGILTIKVGEDPVLEVSVSLASPLCHCKCGTQILQAAMTSWLDGEVI
jgi:hypothetical protein